ncbi:transposase family protein [Propionibacterium australiense]|uniref:transposase family protein n=1 Tax=Propionibacterium australiense TaxID=119981 RepID=UPI00147735B5
MGDWCGCCDPAPGSTHDAKAIQSTGFLENFSDIPPLGDKGYIGLGMRTPIRKPLGGGLTDWQKQYNKTINRLRAPVERAIAQLKTWRILHTGYRRPLAHLPRNHHSSHRTRIPQKQFRITLHD